ncbi:MAG: hypothetical protein HY533_00525 [Chloroflexi bacterium]|nr:hypothetical protein [Chloroflexota bacterium]
MPSSKSRRIASRQAQLSGRSRHARSRGPTGIPLPRSPEEMGQSIATLDGPGAEATTAAERPAQTGVQPTARRPQPVRPGRPRSGLYVMPPETYFGREMRRIAIILSVMLGLLVVLTIVLK